MENRLCRFRQFIFAITLLSSHGNGHGLLFEQTLNALQPSELCAMFGQIWPRCPEEEDEKVYDDDNNPNDDDNDVQRTDQIS